MKDYYEILNRKTPRDNWADSLQSHADSIGKPMNKNQAAAKAIYGGFAAGLRNDMDREAKIREIEEGSRQTAMLDKELKMFTAKNQVKKEKYNLFLNENYAGLMQLSDLMQKGEDGKVDILGPELFANFSNIMGEDLGKFSHYKNGYFNFIDKKGEPRTINSMNLLQPLIANLPDDQKQNFKGFLTPLQMKDIDRLYEEKQLKIDKYRAEINSANASAELHRSQGYKARNEMSELQKLDYKSQLDQKGETQKSRLKANNDFLEGLSKENTKASNILPILDEFSNLITSSPDLFGSSKWKEAKRAIAKFTGDDAPIQRANYLQKYFFPEIKGIAGNPNLREWGDLVGKIISESQNVEAALAQIALDKKILQGKQREFDNYSKVLSGTNHNYYYYDPEITSRIKRLEKQGVLVKVKAPDGSIKEIPEEQAQLAISQGKGVLVNE